MKRQVAGYTILEAMIVLAVTGVLFALVIPMYSSRDAKTKFIQSVNDLDQKITDVINDVSTGYFPTNDNIQCTVNPLAGTLIFSSSSGEQGTRKDCVFLGKVMHFNDPNSNGASNMNIFTVVGRREDANGQDITKIDSNSLAKAVTTPIDLTEVYPTKWAMTINKVVFIGAPTPQIGSFGIMTDPSPVGNKKLDLFPIMSSSLNDPNSVAAGDINANTWINKNPTSGVLVCIFDSKTKLRAGILIGGVAGQGQTKTFIGEENLVSLGSGICN